MNRNQLALLLSLLVGISVIGFFFFGNEKEVDFSTEIKPILNKHCISCHGGVKKSGGFSLLFEEEAFAPTESGHPAIVPGSSSSSELIKRLTHSDPELRMPYQRTQLSEEEIELLKEWIDQGAKWGKHWAYEPVQEPKLPINPTAASLGANESNTLAPIDFFVREKLEAQGLTPSPQENSMQLPVRIVAALLLMMAPLLPVVRHVDVPRW